jgi:hypothetical protein
VRFELLRWSEASEPTLRSDRVVGRTVDLEGDIRSAHG